MICSVAMTWKVQQSLWMTLNESEVKLTRHSSSPAERLDTWSSLVFFSWTIPQFWVIKCLSQTIFFMCFFFVIHAQNSMYYYLELNDIICSFPIHRYITAVLTWRPKLCHTCQYAIFHASPIHVILVQFQTMYIMWEMGMDMGSFGDYTLVIIMSSVG